MINSQIGSATRAGAMRGFKMLWVLMFAGLVSIRPAALNSQESAKLEPDPVAMVAGVPIRLQYFEQEVRRLTASRALNSQQQLQVRQAVLDKLIDQQVVYRFLTDFDLAAGPSEVQVQLDALQAELARFDRTLEDHCADRDLLIEELKFEFAWQIAWRRYLKQKLTDDNLEAHYLRHRRQFDGTELDVAHLLLAGDGGDDLATRQSRGREILDQLQRRELTWTEAVETLSDGTRADEGHLGWIQRDRPMPDEFSAAAFELNPGQISDPVTTRSGVHLIKCLAVREGKRGWRDAREAVERDAAAYLFRQIVEQNRKSVEIQINREALAGGSEPVG